VGRFDTDLTAYLAQVPSAVLDLVIDFDWVLYVEPQRRVQTYHDQSQPLIGADYIRPGSGLTTGRYDGSSVIVGIMDTGFLMGGSGHQDLNKNGCGSNFTTDGISQWTDPNGHGTHVLGTIIGSGTADSRYKGVATGVGGTGSTRVRAAKVFTTAGTGNTNWVLSAMDWLDDESVCSSPRPDVINYSGGASGSALVGTEGTSRKLDNKSWTFGQLYVISSGNDGPTASTVGAPGVAKNALTVGNVFDFGITQVGDLNSWDAAGCSSQGFLSPCASSRGPTGDNRMKPNVSAPGTWVDSADSAVLDGYTTKFGTSMAAPHVAGLAATLMDHYPSFKGEPYKTRAWLMASSLLHDDVTTPSDNDLPASGDRNKYGIGRVSSYAAHWTRNNPDGWVGYFASGMVGSGAYSWQEVEVPTGTDRLVVVMTWDEPAASAGASAAVIDDIDLWIDRGNDCTGGTYPGSCGEYASISLVDNVEYVIIENPPSGTYRLKAAPWAVSEDRPFGFGTVVIRGDTTPEMTFVTTPSTTTPALNTDFTITQTVTNSSWIASGVHLARLTLPIGITQTSLTTTREDNVAMEFGTEDDVTLGNIREGDSRQATWTLQADSLGLQQLIFSASSENGGLEPGFVLICPLDSYESDNSAGQATTLSQGLTPPHSICPGTDADWGKFTLPGPAAISLDMFGSSIFNRMQLYDSTLGLLESDEQGGTKPTLSIDRTCALDPLGPGTYYVKVDASDSNPVGFYSLTFTVDESCGCADELTLDNDTLTGTRTYTAGTGITLGPDLIISGAQIDMIAGQWVAIGNGTQIGGSFSAGTQANICS
jgi:subtilisin family serine protease